jgi:hypothetical protein
MGRTHYCSTDRVHFTWDTGNMDTRQLVRGTTLFLPVQVDLLDRLGRTQSAAWRTFFAIGAAEAPP